MKVSTRYFSIVLLFNGFKVNGFQIRYVIKSHYVNALIKLNQYCSYIIFLYNILILGQISFIQYIEFFLSYDFKIYINRKYEMYGSNLESLFIINFVN